MTGHGIHVLTLLLVKFFDTLVNVTASSDLPGSDHS